MDRRGHGDGHDHGALGLAGRGLGSRATPLQAAHRGAEFAIRGSTDALRSGLLHDGGRVRVTMVQLPSGHAAVRLGAQPLAGPAAARAPGRQPAALRPADLAAAALGLAAADRALP